jgi:hypothetical protein
MLFRQARTNKDRLKMKIDFCKSKLITAEKTMKKTKIKNKSTKSIKMTNYLIICIQKSKIHVKQGFKIYKNTTKNAKKQVLKPNLLKLSLKSKKQFVINLKFKEKKWKRSSVILSRGILNNKANFTIYHIGINFMILNSNKPKLKQKCSKIN